MKLNKKQIYLAMTAAVTLSIAFYFGIQLLISPQQPNTSTTDTQSVAKPTIITPSPAIDNSTINTPTELEKPELSQLVNIDVPFTSQSPDKKWDAIGEDACE